MTCGAAEKQQSDDVLNNTCGPQILEPETSEEQPPIAPAAVLCLAAIVIAVFGLNHWKDVPGSTSSSPIEFNTLTALTASSLRNDWRAPMQLNPAAGSRLSKPVGISAKPDKGSVVALAERSSLVPTRPPRSFKVANVSAMVFDQVQSDQWLVPAATFPQMMAPDMHKTYSTEWKPMVSWRKSSSGETLLPIARVRCGGLSPQAVARRADKFDVLIGQLAQKYSVDENLVKAIITRESCFDQAAVSHVGAIGLMQLMPATAKWLKVKNPAKAEANLAGGVRYFASLHKEFGSLELALAAYNAGPGNVRRYGGIPPFRETQSYVKTVLGFYRRYSAADLLVSS